MEQLSQDIKWFIQQFGLVQGPFDTISLQSTIDSIDAGSLDQTYIWRRGFNEWLKASQFQLAEHTQPMIMTQVKQAPSLDQTTLLKNAKPTAGVDQLDSRQESFYRVQVNFVDQPLMTKNELLILISKQEDVSVIAIQDPQSKEWKEVYAYIDIVEKLGLSRRNHPRVPILAQFLGRTKQQENFFARIITVSEGGMGFTEVYDLKIGDEVEGQMTSPHFFQPINVKADVVYSGLDGYIGLKFNQINDESQAALIDYIKKFGTGSGMTPT
jgi:hypothetical protein